MISRACILVSLAMAGVLLEPAISVEVQRNSPLQAFSWGLSDREPFPEEETEGNYLSLINDGYDAFLIRVHLIRNAEFSIDIQTFILANDECGQYLTNELIQAARRGVKVRMLVDHFMSSRDRKWVAYLASVHPNFELKYYRPPTGQVNPSKVALLLHSALFFQQTNQRMHNKILLVDGAIALTGGRNIDNHYYNNSLSYNFVDLDAVVLGPLVPSMQDSFEEFWKWRRSIPAQHLGDVAATIRRSDTAEASVPEDLYFERIHRDADDSTLIETRFVDTLIPVRRLRFLSDPPGKNRIIGFWGGGKATRQLRKTIRRAEDELLMQSPYLILNRTGRRHFRKLRRQNPEMDIVVSTNSFAATDNTLAYSANYKLRTAYIQTIGMDIYEYMPHPEELLDYLPNHAELAVTALEKKPGKEPFLCIHAKAFVVDNEIGYVGSYNIDPRSDNLNTELGLLIEDPTVVAQLREIIVGRTRPENSWVIAEKRLALADVNFLVEGLFGLSPVDIWPIRNTSSFELLPGKEAVPREHPDFYLNYKDVGSFPGADAGSIKQLTTSLYKVFNGLAIPVL
jgi:cardiolipin synthase C